MAKSADIQQLFQMMKGFAASGEIYQDSNFNFRVEASSVAFQPIKAAFEALKPEEYLLCGRYVRDVVRNDEGKIAVFFCDRQISMLPRVMFTFVPEEFEGK